MSHENPRKSRLLREALGEDERLPTFRHTCVAIGLIGASLLLIGVTGYSTSDQITGVAVGDVYQAYVDDAVAANPHVATDAPRPSIRAITRQTPALPSGWPIPAESAGEPGETGNAVDLTY